jgi:hypothetical protein
MVFRVSVSILALVMMFAGTSRADIVLDLDYVADATGADIVVSATADPSAIVGGAQVVLQLSNYVNIVGSVNFTQTEIAPFIKQGAGFGTTPDGTASAGSNISFVSLTAGALNLTLTPSDIYTLRVDVPGGFNPGQSFDVQVLASNGGTVQTAVGSATLGNGLSLAPGAVSSTVAAVPEVSSFVMLGACFTLAGVGRWWSRSKQKA